MNVSFSPKLIQIGILTGPLDFLAALTCRLLRLFLVVRIIRLLLGQEREDDDEENLISCTILEHVSNGVRALVSPRER